MMYRAIGFAAVVLAVVAAPAAAQSWTFVSRDDPTRTSPLCSSGLACGPEGYQRGWVVPQSGRYKITTAGAEGGYGYGGFFDGQAYVWTKVAGGAGAVMTGVYSLSAGTQMAIIAGQAGRNVTFSGNISPSSGVPAGGGGGGSFVFSVPQLRVLNADTGFLAFDLSASTLLAAAGGGGGTTAVARPVDEWSLFNILPGGPGLAGRDGGTVAPINGGRNIMGGVNGGPAGKVPDQPVDEIWLCSNSGASYRQTAYCGADFFTQSQRAQSAEGGFYGGVINASGSGGFGGGGAATRLRGNRFWWDSQDGGGGGGGYSGGAGGRCDPACFNSGGGGGSYISDDAVFVSGLSGANRGNGYVTIELLAGVPEPQSWAMLIVGFGFVGTAARRRSAVAAA